MSDTALRETAPTTRLGCVEVPGKATPFPSWPYVCSPQQYAVLLVVTPHATESPTLRLAMLKLPAIRSGMSVQGTRAFDPPSKQLVSFATPSKSPRPKQ